MPVVELAIVPGLDGDEPSAICPGSRVVGDYGSRSQRRTRLLEQARGDRQGVHEGWLRSGDIARIDEEGFVFIVDRAKDMIIRVGERLLGHLEAIFEHPDVATVRRRTPTRRWVKRSRPSSSCGRDTCSRPKRSIATWPHLARFEMRPDLLSGRATPRNPQGKVSSANFGLARRRDRAFG